MFAEATRNEYYQALMDRNSRYDGVFYVGVRTTGIVCRPVCPARKPKFENCEFYESVEQALQAGFRPCKRCHPLDQPQQRVLKTARLDTQLGPMVALADDEALYLLEFGDGQRSERQVERLVQKAGAVVEPGLTGPIHAIEHELADYFEGNLKTFKTPLRLIGTPFQKQVWEMLRQVPYGETRAYADIAAAIGKPTASRAVGAANGANPISIVIPCHRIRGAGGELTGYGGGLARKEWLIRHETQGAAS